MRSCVFTLALIAGLVACDQTRAAIRGQVIPETAARQHGLTRPWFTQAQVDPARARLTHVVLDAGTLFAQTDQAVLQAIDAETGQTLWAEEVGRRGHPSFAPAANQYYVAVVNGSFLYVLNRVNGKLLWQTQLQGAPGAAAALSEDRVYVPMVDGMVTSYLLEPAKDPLEELGMTREQMELSPEDKKALEAERREAIRLSQEYVPPLSCKSYGRAFVQPLVTGRTEDAEYVAWPTDRGFMFVGYISQLENHFAIRYRLETGAGIAARPAYSPANPKILPDSGLIYAASRDGYVYAITEKGGESLWRFSTADPIVEPAIVIGETVYAVTQPGALHCLDAKSGTEKWWTYQVAQFVAASKDRVYALDKLNRILVLSAASGARLDVIPAEGFDLVMRNSQTDRIYLATSAGLIQCLHEVELPEPIVHVQAPQAPPEKSAPKEEAAKQPEAEPQAAPAANPFEGGPPAAAPAAAPPAAGAQPAPPAGAKPAPAGAGNPFGDGAKPAPVGGEDPFK
jgi:outer membrane protein assembly factor BamB